jgi:hypothetical protein
MAGHSAPWVIMSSSGVILPVMPMEHARTGTAGRCGWPIALGAALALGCGDPPRPVFEPDGPTPDTVPPQVAVVAPAESVFASGEPIEIQVEVRDEVRVDAVEASVSGALNFGWPVVFPEDTFAVLQYTVDTGSLIAGDLTFLAIAFDTVRNRGSALRQFYVR